MKPRISLFVAFAILLAAATASGAPAALYRIELRDGTRVLAQDRPYHRGSVVLFHLYPRGVLTSLPEEEVVGVTTSAVEVTQKVLRPGDVIVLGPTGAGAALEPPAAVVVAPMMSGRVYDPRNPAYGYSPPRANLNQPGATSLTLPVVPGDVGRADRKSTRLNSSH